MIVNAGYRGKVGAAAPKFTYTGTYNIRKDGVVELLTSGTIVFLEPKVIDVFMVGGGGSGYTAGNNGYNGYGGGGGGYTRTMRRVAIVQNTPIEVTIGAGGEAPNRPGGSSGFKTFTVNGGSYQAGANGGHGGSGGGGGVASNSDYGTGGSDGNNGESGYPTSRTGGVGQGFTTREFGEATGKLYAGGGGGGRYMSAVTPVISIGGSGGGGAGAWLGTDNAQAQEASAGGANTGGGGGGGANKSVSGSGYLVNSASGGSGIVCFREAQELPELAGTWVLNARLYASENHVAALNMNYSCTVNASTVTDCTQINDTGNYVFFNKGGSEITRYNFSSNSWTNGVPTITIINQGTANDEFRTWLASNATKQ